MAKFISKEIVGDEEAFTMLYSGYSARREKGWHVHIVLSFKNLFQAFGLRKDDSSRIK